MRFPHTVQLLQITTISWRFFLIVPFNTVYHMSHFVNKVRKLCRDVRDVYQLSARQLTAYSRHQQPKLLFKETSEAIPHFLAYFPALSLISPSLSCLLGRRDTTGSERGREVDVAAAAAADYVGFGKQGLFCHVA